MTGHPKRWKAWIVWRVYRWKSGRPTFDEFYRELIARGWENDA